MYLLASALFVASIYSFFVGDVSNAKPFLGAALVLGGARFFLGPQEEASVLRRVVSGVGVFILVVVVVYAIRVLFG